MLFKRNISQKLRPNKQKIMLSYNNIIIFFLETKEEKENEVNKISNFPS